MYRLSLFQGENKHVRLFLFVFFVFGVISAFETVEKSVFELGLVSEKLTAATVHDHYHQSAAPVKVFSGEALGYVTPWNLKGSETATYFRSKFTYVSPTWYHLVIKDGKMKMETPHKIDLAWANEVHGANLKAESASGHLVKIVPRILFDSWTVEQFGTLCTKPPVQDKVIKFIVDLVTKNGYSGVVAELSNAWSSVSTQKRTGLNGFIVRLGEAIHAIKTHSGKAELILVSQPLRIRPESQKKTELQHEDIVNSFNGNDLVVVADAVDRISLMSYDFPTTQVAPTAPIPWMNQSATYVLGSSWNNLADKYTSKLLLGLNFYGYQYSRSGQEAKLCHDFVKFLETPSVEIIYEPNSAEHYFSFGAESDQTYLFYPTLKSISERLELAKKMNLGGVAIWEIGQGCDAFFDLL